MGNILFLDLHCPKPYSLETLKSEPLGGTEATVIRVSEGLASRGHQVLVAQHNRTERTSHYIPLEEAQGRFDAVVHLRTAHSLPHFRKLIPDAKHFIWAHDYNVMDFVRDYPILKDTGVRILGVSRTHKSAIIDALLTQVGTVKGVTVGFVYNPIADDLEPNDSTVYHRRLVFFSSPHKGLSETLEVFKQLRRADKNFHLHVANPGYWMGKPTHLPKGVKNLGCLPHAQVIQEVRQALCVLHVNPVFPETFGLVHAEALAVGTPVVTGSSGANMEVIREARFMVDVRYQRAVIDRVLEFADHRPATQCPEEFRLSNVLPAWEKELFGC